MGKDPEKNSGWDVTAWGAHPVIGRDRLRRGSYLRCFCPHCKTKLNEGDRALFEVETARGETGLVRVAAYLNVFEHHTDLDLEEGQELRDARCPHCHHTLILPEGRCPEDGARIGKFKVAVGQTLVDMRACVRHGCHWYDIDADDEQLLMLEGSDEW